MKKLKYNKAKADKLFRDIVRLIYTNCQICGSTYNLQCAHLISRRYYATRWDIDNAVMLCSGCHIKYTHLPLEWTIWCEQRLGKMWSPLKEKALNRLVVKTNYKELTTELQTKIGDLTR